MPYKRTFLWPNPRTTIKLLVVNQCWFFGDPYVAFCTIPDPHHVLLCCVGRPTIVQEFNDIGIWLGWTCKWQHNREILKWADHHEPELSHSKHLITQWHPNSWATIIIMNNMRPPCATTTTSGRPRISAPRSVSQNDLASPQSDQRIHAESSQHLGFRSNVASELQD